MIIGAELFPVNLCFSVRPKRKIIGDGDEDDDISGTKKYIVPKWLNFPLFYLIPFVRCFSKTAIVIQIF